MNTCPDTERLLTEMARRRVGRMFMYAGLVFSSIFLILDPSRIVALAVPTWLGLTWNLCMFVSAAICCWGAVTDRWIGEYGGLPLLASVMFFYGGSALYVVVKSEPENHTLLAFGLILTAFGAGLCARWKDVENLLEVVDKKPGLYTRLKSRLGRRKVR